MPRPTLTSLERVRGALADRGLPEVTIEQFDASTATDGDAAAAIGTAVEGIVKSLVFLAGETPMLASGPNRFDVHKVASLAGDKITRANADQVRQFMGFAIGGVPPVGHVQPLAVYAAQRE